jgi:regulator of sigma E protease
MMEYLPEFLTSFPRYIVAALLVFTPIVFIHELGHFLVARWCGIKIDTFSIGFGKELFGFDDRHGTHWQVSAVPLGGYVKFTGDDNAASVPDQAAIDAVPEEERVGLFYFAALWKRVAVVAAGPIANFLLAIAIIASLFLAFGRYELEPRVTEVLPDQPAEQAGIKKGDLILEINGRRIDTFTDVRRVVSLSTGNELAIVVERNGERVSLLAVPERRESPDGLGGVQRIGMLGIRGGGADAKYVLREYGPGEAVVEAVKETGAIIEGTLVYIGRIFVGRESADQLSGPLGIAKMSGDVVERGGGLSLLNLAAILSVSIGLLNLFPIPMLDGGHLMFYAYEAIAGRPLDAKAQDISFRFGFALVILLFLFVTFNDIVRFTGA